MKRKKTNSIKEFEQEFSHFKSFHWKGKEYFTFHENLRRFIINSMRPPYALWHVGDIFDFFKTSFVKKKCSTRDGIENLNVDFNVFSDKQKDLLSAIYLTYMYAGYITGDNFDGKDEKTASVYLSLLPLCDSKKLEDIIKSDSYYPPRPKISSYRIYDDYSMPTIKDIFYRLISIKNVFKSLFKQFYLCLNKLSLIDFSTYDKISSAVSEENFEVFSNIVNNWDHDIIKRLAAFVEETYPITHFIENHESNWFILNHDINSSHSGYKYDELNLSFTGFLFMTLIIYLNDEFIRQHLRNENDQFWLFHGIKNYAEEICEWIGQITLDINIFLKGAVIPDQNNNDNETRDRFAEDGNLLKVKTIAHNKETTNQTGIDSSKSNNEELTGSTPCYLDLSNRKNIDFNKLVKLLTEPNELNNSNVFVSLAEGSGLNAVECLSYFFNHTADYLSFKLNWNGRNKVSLKLLIRLVKHFSRSQSILKKEEKQEGYVKLTPENVVELKTKTGDGISSLVCKEESKAEFWPRVSRVFKGANSVHVATARAKNPETTEANLEEMRTIARLFFACLRKE